MLRRALGLISLALITMAGCQSTPSSHSEDVACAASLLFVAGDVVVDEHRLAQLRERGCVVGEVLDELDDGTEARRLDVAEALYAAGEVALAVEWYERADTLAGYEQLLALHVPDGALADDAAYLRYEVLRAQWQQAFGQEVAWPSVGQAQPLFVLSSRSALHDDTDLDAPVLEALSEDERVYLLDVVVLEGSDEYWVHAYYPPTLTLGWIPAQDMAQYPLHVRQALADLDGAVGRSYAQQLIFSALLHDMDRASLMPLRDGDFFAGADQQRANSVALIQRLGDVADQCLDEQADMEVRYARYLMQEGPMPSAEDAPYALAMREALAALTGRPGPGVTVDEALATQLSDDAHRYFRIRSFGQIEQRLCHSLPNAAGRPEFADPTCEAVASLQSCLNRIDAILL